MDACRRDIVLGIAAAGVAPALSRIPVPTQRPSARQLAAQIRGGHISSVEAIDRAIGAIETGDLVTNAVVVRDFERARREARSADSALKSGDRRPLLGVPITVKESFDVAGLPTSWGIPQFANNRAKADAATVARLRAAGAIVLGKSNLHFQMGLFHGERVPLLLHDWQSFNPLYGTTKNPWDPTATPGGSSGGAAAALAAGFVALELGSDIGGSIRAPAHFCGIFGHKPTSGLVSGEGHAPPGMSGPAPSFPFMDMAAFGPMARSARDLELALPILAAPTKLAAPRARRLRDFRILVVDDHPLMPISAELRGNIEQRVHLIERAGAKVSRGSPRLPDLAASARAYMQALSAFDALAWPATTIAKLKETAGRLDPRDDSLAANRLRGASLLPSALAELSAYRTKLRSQWHRLFDEFDVVLCPVMPTAAFKHDHSDDQETRRISFDGKVFPYMDQLFWPGVATFPGLPATAARMGFTRGGMPLGIQIVGPWLGDMTCIAFAALMEEAFGLAEAA